MLMDFSIEISYIMDPVINKNLMFKRMNIYNKKIFYYC